LTLFYDRYLLCKQYLFKYTDEDQAIMWYAAHELLKRAAHEPCFFRAGLTNSCLGGVLGGAAAGAAHAINVAVPLVTVILGLLPFLLLALVAWKRGHSLVAAAALLVPLIMPVRYSIITGDTAGLCDGDSARGVADDIAAAAGTAADAAPRGTGRSRCWGRGQRGDAGERGDAATGKLAVPRWFDADAAGVCGIFWRRRFRWWRCRSIRTAPSCWCRWRCMRCFRHGGSGSSGCSGWRV